MTKQRPCLCDKEGCNRCHLFNTDNMYNKAWGGPGIVETEDNKTSNKSIPRTLPCIHLGLVTEEMERCPSCTGETWLKLFKCNHTIHETTTIKNCTEVCRDYVPRLSSPTFYLESLDPTCGVVIGTYTKWPTLIELQVRLIRQHCGLVPILIADDCSPCSGALVSIAATYKGVTYWPNVQRIGHSGGDLSALWKGILWASGLGLKVLAKLSQRYLVDTPRWLQNSAIELLSSGLPLATQLCKGRENFPIRSEALLVDVKAWNTPSVISRLTPRTLGKVGEYALAEVFNEQLGGQFLPWSLIGGPDRYKRTQGVLWHCTNTVEEYRQLASQHGLTLPDDFHTLGWQVELARGTYLYG